VSGSITMAKVDSAVLALSVYLLWLDMRSVHVVLLIGNAPLRMLDKASWQVDGQ
jgi:hypothetical protein